MAKANDPKQMALDKHLEILTGIRTKNAHADNIPGYDLEEIGTHAEAAARLCREMLRDAANAGMAARVKAGRP